MFIVIDQLLTPTQPQRNEARQEVYRILNRLIDTDSALDINHRELSRLLRIEGITPACSKGNCIIHESATAISTLKVARPGLMITRGQAEKSMCDCQWAYLAGFVSKV